MINDNPLEEGVDNQRTQEDFIFEELAALNEARKTLFDDSTTDYTNDYNTELTDDEEQDYQNWKRFVPELDESIYDYRGLYKETFGSPVRSTRLSPKYRKPSHMEFTTDSIYNGADGNIGGAYKEDGTFEVGYSSPYSTEEVENYFGIKYPSISITDNRSQTSQVDTLREKLQSPEGYSYVLDEATAYRLAERKGDRTAGENIKKAFDPTEKNIAGRVAAIGLGGAIGAGIAAAIPIVGIPAVLAGIVLSSAGAMFGDGAAVAWSQRDEDEIEETLLRLDADDYVDPMEREAAEKKVASWYNDTLIEKYRGNTWGGTVSDVFLESLPYMASFLVPGRALAGTVKPLKKGISNKIASIVESSKDGKTVRGLYTQLKGGKEVINVASPFKITKEQSKEILRKVKKLDEKGQKIPAVTRNQMYRKLMKDAYDENVSTFIKSKGARLGIAGPGSLLIQQPKVFSDLKNEELESVYVEDGKFKFDKFTGADIAKKEAQAVLAILVETVGFDLASKLFKNIGVHKLLKPVKDNVVKSKAYKTLGGAAVAKTTKDFFDNNTIGKSLSGKTQLMKEFKQVTQYGSIFEEAAEEWIEMTTSAILGLDSDERKAQGMSYAENLVDKAFFPVLHPKEASAILVAVGIIPAGAGVVSKLRGDTLQEEFSQQVDMLNNFLSFQDKKSFRTDEEAAEAFEQTEEFVESMLDFEANKKWYQKGIVGAILRPGKQQQFLVQQGLNIDSLSDLNSIVNKRAEELAAENKTEVTEEIKNKAVRQIVSERLIVRLAENKEDAELLTNLISSKIIVPYRPNIVATDTRTRTTKDKTGQTIVEERQFTTNVFRIDAKKRKELEKDKELGATYKRLFSGLNLINVTKTTKQAEALVNRKIKSGEFKRSNDAYIKEYNNALANPNEYKKQGYKSRKEYIEAKRKAAIDFLEKQLKLFDEFEITTQGKVSAASLANSRKRIRSQLSNLVDTMIKKLAEQPDTEIFIGETIISEGAGGGRTTGGIFQATNVENKIIITPSISLRDSAARVLEEESLELNLKKLTGGRALISFTAEKTLKSIRSKLTTISKYKYKGKPTKKAIKAQKILDYLNIYSQDSRGDFELFISLVQNRYGSQDSRENDLENDLFDLITDKQKNDFNVAVLQNFSGEVKNNLIKEMSTSDLKIAEEIEKDIGSTGKRAVERFIETKPDTPAKKLKRMSKKIREAKQEAIEEVKQKVITARSETERFIAIEVLKILESEAYDDKSNVERKRKRALKKLHMMYPDMTYSFLPNENSPEGDQEIEQLESTSSDMEFDSTHGDRFLKGKIQQQIIAASNRRTGTINIIRLKDADWFIDAISSEEKYKEFKEGTHATSLERLIQKIAQTNSLEDMRSFHRKNISNHVQRYFKKLGNKLQMSNLVLPFEEMYDSVLDVHDNPDLKLEHYEKLLPIVDKNIEDLTSLEIVIILSVVEENTGIPISKLADINLERNNSIVRRIMTLTSEDLEISVSKTGKKRPAKRSKLKDAILHGAAVDKKIDNRTITVFGFPEKDGIPEGILYSVMKSDISEFTSNPMFTNVEKSQKSAIRGDSHFDFIIDKLYKSLNIPEELDKDIKQRFVMFLDGIEFENLDVANMSGAEISNLIEEIFDNEIIGNINKNLKDKNLYYHHMGRFGEKGAAPFVLMEYHGTKKSNLLDAAKKALALLPKNKDAKKLFVDPVKLIESYPDKNLTKKQIMEAHYAINDIILMNAMHGDISNYMLSDKKTKDMSEDQKLAANFLNIIARQSQILTDGMRYRGSLNVIQIEDIPGITDSGGDAFDGQAMLTNDKLIEIADDMEIKDTDTLKAHISTSTPGDRTLIKVNWINMDLAGDSNPVMSKLKLYIDTWNKNNPDNKIEAIVFPSGAKLSRLENTNWENNEDPKIIKYEENDNLIVSQDLHHSNNSNHDGQIPSQRQAHFNGLNVEHNVKLGEIQRVYLNNGLKAVKLRNEAALSRFDEAELEVIINETSSPALQEAYALGLDVENDPRFVQEILNIKLSQAKKLLAHKGKRLATQTMGQADLQLTPYEEVTDKNGNNLIKLARINVNIVGGRYETRTDFDGEPFSSLEDAIDFIKKYPSIFADMFWVKEDGTPDIDHVLEHEIEKRNGSYIIPGEIIDRTRVPSGAYASHSFNRLKNPVSDKYSETNVAVPQDGIRIAMGEDLDGDKGFSLILARKVKSIKNGMYKLVDGNFVVVNPKGVFNLEFVFKSKSKGKDLQDTLENKALLLEHIMWINADTFEYYNVKGDIPKDAFDSVINRESDPIYEDLKFGSIVGRENSIDINLVRNKVIGIIAVHNAFYSNTNSIDIDPFGSSALLSDAIDIPQQINLRLKDKNITINAPVIKGNRTNIQSRTSYRSTKSIFDIFLNQALDDHKDPRLFFANINADTAPILASLLFSNINNNDIPSNNDAVKDSLAGADAKILIEFLKSDHIKLFNELLKVRRSIKKMSDGGINKENKNPFYTHDNYFPEKELDILIDKIIKEKKLFSYLKTQAEIDDQVIQLEVLLKSHKEFSKSALKGIRNLNATHKSVVGKDNLIRIMQSRDAVSDVTSGINPLAEHSDNVINEYIKIGLDNIPALDKLISKDLLNILIKQYRTDEQSVGYFYSLIELFTDEYGESDRGLLGMYLQVNEVLNIFNILQSLYESDGGKGIIKGTWIRKQRQTAVQLFEKKSTSKLLKKLTVSKSGFIQLDNRTRSKDLTQTEIVFLRESFDNLSKAEKIALSTVLFLDHRLKNSTWTGSYAQFITPDILKVINSKLKEVTAEAYETNKISSEELFNILVAIDINPRLQAEQDKAEDPVRLKKLSKPTTLSTLNRYNEDSKKQSKIIADKIKKESEEINDLVEQSNKKLAKEKPKENPKKLTVQEKATKEIRNYSNPSALKHIPKEQVKTQIATQFIGQGKENSSTDRYRKMYDELFGLANTGNYTEEDIIMISSNGKRRDRYDPIVDGVLQGDYKNIDKAIEAGSTFVMDTADHLKKYSYNLGEEQIAAYLENNGYERVAKSGPQSGIFKKQTDKKHTVTLKTTPANKLSISDTMGELVNLGAYYRDLGFDIRAVSSGDIVQRYPDKSIRVNHQKLAEDFINNNTDNIKFDNAVQYGQYVLQKFLLKEAGNKDVKKQALKNINFIPKKIDPDLTASFIQEDRINQELIDLANQLVAEGKTEDQIFAETGLYRFTKDGGWRLEIDDSKVVFRYNGILPTRRNIKLGDLIKHPVLFKAYPELKDLMVRFRSDKDANTNATLGSYQPAYKGRPAEIVIFDGYKFMRAFSEPFLETFFHELQHAIQDHSNIPETETGSNLKTSHTETMRLILDNVILILKILESSPNVSLKNKQEMFENKTGERDTEFIRNNAIDMMIHGLPTDGVKNALMEYDSVSKWEDEFFVTFSQLVASANRYRKPIEQSQIDFQFYSYITNIGEIESNIAAVRSSLSRSQRRKIHPKETATNYYRKHTQEAITWHSLKMGDQETLDEYIDRVGTIPTFPAVSKQLERINLSEKLKNLTNSEMTASMIVQSELINDNVLKTLEKYGFEISDADTLFIDIVNKKIALDELNIEQVAIALAETISFMMQRKYSIDLLNDDEFKKSPVYKNYLAKQPSRSKKDKIEAVRLMFQNLLQKGYEEKLLDEYNEVRTQAEEARRIALDIATGIKSLDMSMLEPLIENVINKTFSGEDFIRTLPIEDRVQVGFQDAFDESPLAKDIMNSIGTDENIFLTGSIVLATQGTVYRKPGGLVHDLDFISNYNTPKESANKLLKEFPGTILAYNFLPPGQDTYVETYLVPPKGYIIDRVKRHPKTRKILSYRLLDKDKKVVGRYLLSYVDDAKGKPTYGNEDQAFDGPVNLQPISVDFFTSMSGDKLPTNQIQDVAFVNNEGETIAVSISTPDRVMDAKLMMSRIKDIFDYNRYILFDRLPNAKLEDTNIPYSVDKRLNIRNSIRNNGHLSNKQIIYNDLADRLINSGIEIDKVNGNEIHYNTIYGKIKKIEKDKLYSIDNNTYIKEPDIDTLALKALVKAEKVIMKFKNIGKLPGDIQSMLYMSILNDTIDNKILNEIDKFNYQKAVDLIVDLQITSNKQLVKSILEFDSLKDTINKISINKSPNVFTQLNRMDSGYSEQEVREYLLNVGFYFKLIDQDINIQKIFGTIQDQMDVLKEVEKTNDMEMLGVVKKAIRLTNGVPTKYQLNNNTVDERIVPGEITQSMLIMDRALDLGDIASNDEYGFIKTADVLSPKQLMQNSLLFGTRQGRELIRYGRANKAYILSVTGSSKYVTEDGKVYKRTEESDRQGRLLREALTIFLETYKDENGKVNKKWQESSIINTELARELIRYRKYEQAFNAAQRKKRDTFEFEGEIYSAKKEDKEVKPSIPTVGQAFQSWELWKSNKESTGVHPKLLDTTDTDTLFNELNEIFKTQYDQLEKTSGYIGELWFAKRTNYVPHTYAKTKEELEKFKKLPYADREQSRSEEGRIYDTYIQAFNTKELVPKNLDLVNLIEEYTEETAKVSRQRVSVSAMAQVTDEDMLPMMLVEGIEKMGILTEPAAHAIANKLELAMFTIDSKFKSEVPKNINGFERLTRLTEEVNPAELGYEVVEVGYKSIKTAWVKKGTAAKLMGHIFADQKDFKHNFQRIVFDSLLTMNHVAKTMSIGLSLFHPFALIESLIALDGINGLEKRSIERDKNGNFIRNKDGSYKYRKFAKWDGNLLFHPFRTVKDIRREYQKTINNPTYGSEWVQAGLQFDTGRSPDIEYGLINSKLDNVAANMINGPMLYKGLGHGLKIFNKAKWATDRWLWEVMLPGMKMYSANNLYAVEAERQIEMYGKVVNEKQLREDISAYVNDAFGGQEWEKYMWANQRVRKWLNLFMFAPDWTLSALNISGVTHLDALNKAIGSPTSELHARNRLTRYWIAFPTIVLMGIPNILQASIWALAQATGNGDDEDEVFTFGNEPGHKLHVDITPFWRTIGAWDKIGRTQRRRTYLAWGKQAYEVFGPKGWLRDPMGTALGKSSIGFKIVMEQGFDMVKPGWETPWAKHDFLESIFAVDGNMWDGRLAAIGKKFVPLSLQPILDGMMDPTKSKPTTFFAPVKLGMNSYTAQREIASVLRVYAEGGIRREFKGIVKNARLEDVVAEIVDAAVKNGYDGDRILAQGISQARSYYYEKFFKALEAKDNKKMDKAAALLRRLDTNKSQIELSVERKLEQSKRKLDINVQRSINDAWFGRFRSAANK